MKIYRNVILKKNFKVFYLLIIVIKLKFLFRVLFLIIIFFILFFKIIIGVLEMIY